MLQRCLALIWAASVISTGLGSRVSARADPRPSEQRKAWRTQAAALPGVTVSDLPDYNMVSSGDGLTRYYFSKPNNPAYPFAIALRIEIGPASGTGGCRDISLPTSTSAEDASDAAYRAADRWMAVLEDGVMKEYADSRRR